jgi:hypothetical protein
VNDDHHARFAQVVELPPNACLPFQGAPQSGVEEVSADRLLSRSSADDLVDALDDAEVQGLVHVRTEVIQKGRIEANRQVGLRPCVSSKRGRAPVPLGRHYGSFLLEAHTRRDEAFWGGDDRVG